VVEAFGSFTELLASLPEVEPRAVTLGGRRARDLRDVIATTAVAAPRFL
jgi:hypothetical protein